MAVAQQNPLRRDSGNNLLKPGAAMNAGLPAWVRSRSPECKPSLALAVLNRYNKVMHNKKAGVSLSVGLGSILEESSPENPQEQIEPKPLDGKVSPPRVALSEPRQPASEFEMSEQGRRQQPGLPLAKKRRSRSLVNLTSVIKNFGHNRCSNFASKASEF